MPRVIGYTYCADTHCVSCTQEAANVGILTRVPPLELGTDEHGLAYDLTDREGNRVHPMFSTDEVPARGEHCGDCGNVIAEGWDNGEEEN